MTDFEALEIVGMITAGYPSWKPTKESLRLYAKLLEPFEEGLTKATVIEILYSPREFAPPIGEPFFFHWKVNGPVPPGVVEKLAFEPGQTV